MRVCNMCKVEKQLEDFSFSAHDKKNNRQYHCKKCSAEYKRKIGGSYPNHKKNHLQDYRKGLVRAAKHRAKLKNLPFNITWRDFELIDVCPVLGIAIFSESLDNPNAPSIDRFIPELGYVKGNVFIISRRANVLKGDANIEEMKLILKYMQNGNDGLHYDIDQAYQKVHSDYSED